MTTTALIFVILSVVFAIATSQMLRLSQRLKLHQDTVCVVNYVAGALCCVLWAVITMDAVNLRAVLPGLLAGIFFATNYYLLIYSFQRYGVARPFTILILGNSVAIIVSILLWGERPSLPAVAGMLLTVAAVPMIASGKTLRGADTPGGAVWALLLLFVGQGVNSTACKLLERMNLSDQQPLFVGVTFAMAALVGLLIARLSGRIPQQGMSARTLAVAAGIGVCNVTGAAGLVIALAHGPASVIFPLQVVGITAGGTLVSMLLWRERYHRLNYIGLAVATVAVLLLNR